MKSSSTKALESHRLFEAEKRWRTKSRYIAGVDEAGRGPLAGPIVAAAVILPDGLEIPGVDDSKKLTPRRRADLFGEIISQCLGFGIGIRSNEFIDRYGISAATFSAMKMALYTLSLKTEIDLVLVDGYPIPELHLRQEAIIDGDAKIASIACASILAKVTRDRIMGVYERLYPGYDFDKHKGYCTKRHVDRLRAKGPSPIHRTSFSPVSLLISGDRAKLREPG